jgi:F-box-like domain
MEDVSDSTALLSLDNIRTRLEVSNTYRGHASLPHATSTGLLDLPWEIRRQIYNYCIPTKRLVHVNLYPFFSLGIHFEKKDATLNFVEDSWGWGIDGKLNTSCLLLLSRQISNECLDILYGENIFKLCLNWPGDEIRLQKTFGEANRRRMRYLLLLAYPLGVSTYQSVPDDAMWASILPGLRILRIVAKQTLKPQRDLNLRQEMGSWVKWIEPYLKCFGQHLSAGTLVEIDDNGRAGELAEQYLPHGYQKVISDGIFRRRVEVLHIF